MPGSVRRRRRSRNQVDSLLPMSRVRLTAEEVRPLWSFVHGDIMDPGIRVQLRRSLGLCPRHTWAYAVVEIELEANRLIWTRRWCLETASCWSAFVCPACAGPADVSESDEVPLCRAHLLELERLPFWLRDGVAARLLVLRDRTHQLNGSMTQGGPRASAADDSSWIETLGFFAGWSLPLGLVQIPDSNPERFD